MAARAWDSFSATCVHLRFCASEASLLASLRRAAKRAARTCRDGPSRGRKPKEGYGPAKDRSWQRPIPRPVPRRGCTDFVALVAVTGRVIGADQIGHDRGSRLRVILQEQAKRVCLVGVDARLVFGGEGPLRNIAALADVNPGVLRLVFGERNALGQEIYGAQRLECILAQIDSELVAPPRCPNQRHGAELWHAGLRIGHTKRQSAKAGFRDMGRPRRLPGWH